MNFFFLFYVDGYGNLEFNFIDLFGLQYIWKTIASGCFSSKKPCSSGMCICHYSIASWRCLFKVMCWIVWCLWIFRVRRLMIWWKRECCKEWSLGLEESCRLFLVTEIHLLLFMWSPHSTLRALKRRILSLRGNMMYWITSLSRCALSCLNELICFGMN